MSFPLRGRGLKSSGPIRSIKGILSFPLRERGLKLYKTIKTIIIECRSPCGERGLKFLDFTPFWAYNNCSPAGTWVNIVI